MECEWQPMETAPKGGGAKMTTDPAWVEPPRVLLAFAGGELAIGKWDWYYARGSDDGLISPGSGATDHGIAWVNDEGLLLVLEFDGPIAWMPLPPVPARTPAQEVDRG